MVKKMLRGWQGPKAGRGVGSGRWGGWTGRRVDGEGWMATGRGGGGDRRGNLEGGNGEGEMGRGAIGMGRGWQWRGGQGEEEMERGAMGKGGRWEGGTGRGGKGKEVGMGRGEEGARGGEISQMDMMGCLCGHRL